jgi:two-component system CheB/CheR fusion protein
LSLELLKRTQAGSAEEGKARAIIERQSHQLTRLVDDLLDVTRITRDKFDLQRESLDLNEVTRDTISDHRHLFEANEIKLTFDPMAEPVMIDGDRNRLAQMIGNLLHNATKFTASGGHTQVIITPDEASQTVELRITDDGAGIDARTLSTLFKPFVQADATLDRSAGGLGLGLSLVKGIVDLHGGQITAESEGVGEGASFAVRLPLADIEDQGAASSEMKSEMKGVRVLLIEDKSDVAAGIQMLLEAAGHHVEIATDGSLGLKKALAILPDAIICDIGLPGMDGFAVAHAIRSAPAIQSIHLIALSGYARPEDVRKALAAGFDHHCAKPPDFDALSDLLYASQNH